MRSFRIRGVSVREVVVLSAVITEGSPFQWIIDGLADSGWNADGLCRGKNRDVAKGVAGWWWTIQRHETREGNGGEWWHNHAIKICQTCPVQWECARYAMVTDDVVPYNVWGGLTPVKRKALRNAEWDLELALAHRTGITVYDMFDRLKLSRGRNRVMKVKMLSSIQSFGRFGEIVDVIDSEAEMLINGNFAEEVKEDAPAPTAPAAPTDAAAPAPTDAPAPSDAPAVSPGIARFTGTPG